MEWKTWRRDASLNRVVKERTLLMDEANNPISTLLLLHANPATRTNFNFSLDERTSTPRSKRVFLSVCVFVCGCACALHVGKSPWEVASLPQSLDPFFSPSFPFLETRRFFNNKTDQYDDNSAITTWFYRYMMSPARFTAAPTLLYKKYTRTLACDEYCITCE